MSNSRRIRIGAWTASPALNLLECGTQSIKIEPRAMDVLAFLAAQPGKVVPVDELIAAVWKGVVVGDGSVYLAINQLRHALDDPGEEASCIETIPKRGYRLTVPAEQLESEPPVGERASQARSVAIGAARSSTLRAGGIVVAAALLVAALAWVLRNGPQPGAAIERSIAVLPFANLSSDPEQGYFADGITEALLNALTGIRDLQVTGRTSSFFFKGKDEDLRTIGATLGVEHVLEGSVRKAGDQVRITAQLVDARTGYHLWSKTYERELDDIFAIQDEIAKAVADSLQITLGVGELGRWPGMTRDVAAYDEFLRGFSLYLQLRPESVPQAIEHLQRAVTLDPSFATAWALLRMAYVNGAGLVPSRAEEWRKRGAEALDRARALTPDAPEILIQTSIDLITRGKWLEAGAVHARAVSVFSQYGVNGEAAAARGYLLLGAGHAREAVDAFERARAIDPLEPGISFGLASSHLAAGDLAAALTEVDRGLDLEGFGPLLRGTGLGAALAARDRAEIDIRLAAFPDGDFAVGLVREPARFLDEPSAAPAAIRRLAATVSPLEKTILAGWAAYYDDPELALELLAAAPPEFAASTGLLWQPSLRDVRKLPGFKELVRSSGLVDYWRVYGWPDACHAHGDNDFVCT